MDTEKSVMNPFVILFRRGPDFPATDADNRRRAAATGVWARSLNAAGHRLDPRLLASECVYRGLQHSDASTGAWPVTALLFLEARDLEEAARIAGSHPAVRDGVAVEVRPWAPPVPFSSSAESAR